MPVADLTALRGGCDVTLHSASHKADAASDALVIKVDLLMLLASRAEAETVEEMLPGLGEVFDRAGEEDNWKGSLSVKPAESLTVALTAKEAGQGQRQGPVAAGGVIIQGAADLAEVKASMSKRQRAVMVRFIFRGHGEEALARIAGVQRLGGSVAMSFERRQGVLQFGSSTKAAPALRVGMIVAAGSGESQVVGRLTEIDGEALSVQDNGTEVTVEARDVISAFAFAQDADTSAALSDYQERCARRSMPVSWRALVEVLAARGATESMVPVTADDVEAAVAKVEAENATDTERTEPEGEPVGEVVEIEAGKRKPRARASA